MREKSVSFLCTMLVLMACFCVSVFAEETITVTTSPADTITDTSAILRGVYYTDGADVTERGFAYKPAETGDEDYKTVVMHGDNSVTKFGYTLDTLIPDTAYTAVAYVKTESGIHYGIEVEFRTLAAPAIPSEAGETPETGVVEDALTAAMPMLMLLSMALASMVLFRNKAQ